MRYQNSAPKSHAGFSMIELMVGIALGLLAVLIIMKTSSLFQDQKSTTLSGSNLQESGMTAMALLQRAGQNAGAGFLYPDSLACSEMAPIRIQNSLSSGSNQPDALVIPQNPKIDQFGGIPHQLTTKMPSNNSYMIVNNAEGFSINDKIVVVNVTDPEKCAFAQITNISSAGDYKKLTISNFTTSDATAHPVYPAGSFVINIGDGLRYQRFRVDNGSLVVETFKDTAAVKPSYANAIATAAISRELIAANVIDMQARYAIDYYNTYEPSKPRDGATDIMCQPLDNSNCSSGVLNQSYGFSSINQNTDKIKRIRSLNVTLLIRSSKPAPGQQTSLPCYSGAPGPCVWPANDPYSPTQAFDLVNLVGTNWQDFRYRKYLILIPIRNVLEPEDL